MRGRGRRFQDIPSNGRLSGRLRARSLENTRRTKCAFAPTSSSANQHTGGGATTPRQRSIRCPTRPDYTALVGATQSAENMKKSARKLIDQIQYWSEFQYTG